MSANVSGKYTISFLVKHPVSRATVLKHLTPLGLDERDLCKVDATLINLMGNMGGGIPYPVIIALIDELDRLRSTEFY